MGEAIYRSDITPHPEHGIGAWTDDQIKRAITQAISRDRRGMVLPPNRLLCLITGLKRV